MNLQSIRGIGSATEDSLTRAGISTVDQLARADAGALATTTGIAENRLEAVIVAARTASEADESPAALIDAMLQALPDWQGDRLARVRELIHQADPDVVESVKWRTPSNPSGVPVWSHDGIVCTGETYANTVKLTFARGADIEDRAGLFNACLGGKTRRAIDRFEGDELDETAFNALVRNAVALNNPAAIH